MLKLCAPERGPVAVPAPRLRSRAMSFFRSFEKNMHIDVRALVYGHKQWRSKDFMNAGPAHICQLRRLMDGLWWLLEFKIVRKVRL